MLPETATQKRIKPPGAAPVDKPSIRRNIMSRTLAQPASATHQHHARSKRVTGWPSHQQAKPYQLSTNAPAAIPNKVLRRAQQQRILPAVIVPTQRASLANKKYIYKGVQPNGYVSQAAPLQYTRAPVSNTYIQPPVFYDTPYPSPMKPAPVVQTKSYIPEPFKQSSCKCSYCGAAGNGCTTLTHFALGSAKLTEDHYKQIDELADTILKNRARFITITGHTDSQGTDENNLLLGFDRANKVAYDLKQTLHGRKHWSQTSIFWKTKTKGESQPVSNTDTGLNRMVVVCLK